MARAHRGLLAFAAQRRSLESDIALGTRRQSGAGDAEGTARGTVRSTDQRRTHNALELDWLVSVDDHVIEPPNVWLDRLPAKYRDDGPATWMDDRTRCGTTTERCAHLRALGDDRQAQGGVLAAPVPFSEMPPAAYDPVARIADMDRAGILASLCFPSFPRFCGQMFWEAKDKELALLCVQAYNDWMIDEWCGAAPGRLHPADDHPALGSRGRAVDEMERCAAKGATIVRVLREPRTAGACPRSTTPIGTGIR